MTKREYLNALVAGLIDLSTDELRRIKAYYEEMIDDRVEEGMTEEDAVAELEPPEALAKKLLEENGVAPSRKAGAGQAAKDRFWFGGEIRELEARIGSIDVDLRVEALEDGCTAFIVLDGVDAGDIRAELTDGRLYVEELEYLRRNIFRFRPRRMRILLNRAELEALDYHTASGDAHIAGLKPAQAAIQTASGDVELEQLACGGELEINAASGDVKLTDTAVAGKLTMHSASGDKKLQWVSAACLALASSSGDSAVETANIGGDIDMGASSGDLTLRTVSFAGECAIQTASGDVKLANTTGGGLRLGTKSGDVELLTCGLEAANIDTTSGDVSLQETDIQGELEVHTISGEIAFKATSAGCMELKTTSGEVRGTLRGVEAYSFSAQSRTGDVRVPTTDGPHSIQAETVSGDIHLRVMP